MSRARGDVRQADIRELIEGLGDEWIGPREVSVLGGRFAARPETIERFLGYWTDAGFAFALWNHTDGLALERLAEPPAALPFPDLLERARLFGGDAAAGAGLPTRGGDLELRRDGGDLRWRFVGPPGVDAAALSGFGCQNFWAQYPLTRLRMQRDSTLLWGQATAATAITGAAFADPRVAKARLRYPVAAQPGERAELTFLTLSSAGQAALIWWLGVTIHGDD